MLASLIFFVIAVLSFLQIAHVMKGDINNSHQFWFRRAARVLYAKSLDERSNISSQCCRVNIFAKVSRLFSLLEALSCERQSILPELNQPLLDGICLVSHRQRPVYREATFRIAGSRQEIHGAPKRRFNYFPNRGLLKSFAYVCLIRVEIALKRLLEEFFLVAESGPHTGAVDPHGICQVGERSPFVSLFPKDAHRCIQRSRRVEPSRATHSRIVSLFSHTILFDTHLDQIVRKFLASCKSSH